MAITTLSTTARITPEQMLELSDDVRYELIDGQLVECSPMSIESCTIAAILAAILNNFVIPRRLGYVVDADGTYQCFPQDPNRVRRPDVSFIQRGRLPKEQYEHGHCRIAPDLAVEIISPNDVIYDVDEKIQDYLSAGISLVWVVNPKTRTVTIYRPQGKPEYCESHDIISGENVLPGLQFVASNLFPDFDSAAE